MLFLSLLPPQGSPSFSAPAWDFYRWIQFTMNFINVTPSSELQLFLNCSSMGPFHRLQSFECLLSCKLLEASGSTCDVMASAWGSSLLMGIWGWWASRPGNILLPGLLEHGCDPLMPGPANGKAERVLLELHTHRYTHINTNTRMMPLLVLHTKSLLT